MDITLINIGMRLPMARFKLVCDLLTELNSNDKGLRLDYQLDSLRRKWQFIIFLLFLFVTYSNLASLCLSPLIAIRSLASQSKQLEARLRFSLFTY